LNGRQRKDESNNNNNKKRKEKICEEAAEKCAKSKKNAEGKTRKKD